MGEWEGDKTICVGEGKNKKCICTHRGVNMRQNRRERDILHICIDVQSCVH